MRSLTALLMLPLLLLAACGDVGVPADPTDPGGAPGGAPDLEGRTFLGAGVTEDGADRPLADGTQVRLAFADGAVTADAGCNTTSGAYRVEGTTLRVDELAMTEMGCEQELMEQDAWLADLLGQGPDVALEGGTLTLTAGSTVLTLSDRVDPDRPLVGTTWRVTGLVTGESVASPPAEAVATLTLAEDGTAAVRPGCNSGSGTWTVTDDGSTLTLGPLALTRMACPGARGELETAVLEVLGAGELSVEITAGTLRLGAGDAGLVLDAD